MFRDFMRYQSDQVSQTLLLKITFAWLGSFPHACPGEGFLAGIHLRDAWIPYETFLLIQQRLNRCGHIQHEGLSVFGRQFTTVKLKGF